MSRLMHQRKAAKVFPVPVGARIKVDSPRAIAGQPCSCGLVGAAKTASNHSRTGGRTRAASRAAKPFEERLLGSDIQGLFFRCLKDGICWEIRRSLKRLFLCVYLVARSPCPIPSQSK